MDIVQSIGYDQHEILNNIIKLHVPGGGFDLDCTYSKGNFYKNHKVPHPVYCTDLVPQLDYVDAYDSAVLPFGDGSLDSIMFDPPFVISGKTWNDPDKGNAVQKRFGCYYHYDELKEHYYNSLKEFYRMLADKGIVVFKLQNTISSGKQYFSHYFVMKSAIELGFYPKDEFVLLSKSKMTSFGGRWKNQIHAMKYHSYFMVFEKSNRKINYKVEG